MVDKNNVRFRASNSFFTNSQCLFAEYCDCVEVPWFTFLTLLQKSTKLDESFDIDLIRYMSLASLLRWYFDRQFRNPLVDLWKGEEKPQDNLDKLLTTQLQGIPDIFDVQMNTYVCQMIKLVIGNKLVGSIIIHNDTYNEHMEKDVTEKFGGKARFVYGDFKDVLKDIPRDSTYIFSDVLKVVTLVECDKIDYSAIMLPKNYRYNFTDDTFSEFLVNMKKLEAEKVFKWAEYVVT